MSVHDDATELLRTMAADVLVDAARRAVDDGSRVWVRDSYGTYGLVDPARTRDAVVVLYPARGGEPPDLEVDEAWLEEAAR